MSDLFMDMLRRRQNRAATDAYTNGPLDSYTPTDYVPHSYANSNDDAHEVEDEIANILSLKLKKPKNWNWELSTSRSCSNIALPRILLYDHKGQLLVDADTNEEQVYKDPEIKLARAKEKENRKRSSRAQTTNLAHSMSPPTLNTEFDGLQIQEATPSQESAPTSPHYTRNSSPNASSSCIDFFTNQLPDYKVERRSNSLKGVRFKDSDATTKSTANSFQFGDLPTPPPSSGTTPTTTTTTSSSSGPREKRRYRRSQSSGRSPSILERFSFNKGRFSSPEYAEEGDVYRPPRYFLRTSKAGTLIVQEESFSRCRRRRPRPKNSSSENINNVDSPRSRSIGSLKGANNSSMRYENLLTPESQTGSLQNVTLSRDRRKKKQLPIRRYRSDGHVLLQTALSTSEEELKPLDDNNLDSKGSNSSRPRRNSQGMKRHMKNDLVSIHPDNGVFHPFGNPTER